MENEREGTGINRLSMSGWRIKMHLTEIEKHGGEEEKEEVVFFGDGGKWRKLCWNLDFRY